MLKYLPRIAIVFVVFLIILRFVVETTFVKNKIVQEVNTYLQSDLNLHLNMNSFELGFFPPALHAYNVQIFPNDQRKNPLLKANRVSIIPSLLKAIIFKFGIQEFQLVSPFLNINKIKDHFEKLDLSKNKKKQNDVWPLSLDSPINLVRIFQAQLYYGVGDVEYTASNVNTVLDFEGRDELRIYGSIAGTSMIQSNKILMNDLALSLDVKLDRSGLDFKYLKMNSSKFTMTAKGRVLPILGEVVNAKTVKNIEDVLDKVDSIFVNTKKREFLGVKGDLELDLVNSDLSFVNNFLDKPSLLGEVVGSGKIKINHKFGADFSKAILGSFNLRSNDAMIDDFSLLLSEFEGEISSGKIKFNRINVKNEFLELANATGEIGLSSDVPLEFSVVPENLRMKNIMRVLDADFDFIDFALDSKKLTLKGQGDPFNLTLGGTGRIHGISFAEIPQERILNEKEFVCPIKVNLDISNQGLDFNNTVGSCSHSGGLVSDLRLEGNVYFEREESLKLDIIANSFGASFFETFIPKKISGVADWKLKLRNPSGIIQMPLILKTKDLKIGSFLTKEVNVDGDIFQDKIVLNKTKLSVLNTQKKPDKVEGKASFYFNADKSVHFVLNKSSLPSSSVKQLMATFFDVEQVSFDVSYVDGSIRGPLMQPFLWKPNLKLSVNDVKYGDNHVVKTISANVKSTSKKTVKISNIKATNNDWSLRGALDYKRSQSRNAVRNSLGYTSADTLRGEFTGVGKAMKLQNLPYIGSIIPESLALKSDVSHKFFITGKINDPKISGDTLFQALTYQGKKMPNVTSQLKFQKEDLNISYASVDRTLNGFYKLALDTNKFSTKLSLKNYLLNFLFSKKIKFDPRNYSYVSADLNYQGVVSDFFGGDGELDLKNFVVNLRQDFFEGDSKIFYRLEQPSKIKIAKGKVIVSSAGVNFRGNFGDLSIWNERTQNKGLDLRFKGNMMFKVLPALIPNIELASGGALYSGRFFRSDGTYKYYVDVKNTNNPKPSFSLRGLRPTFKDVSFDLRVDQDRINVKKFYAQKGSGFMSASGYVYQPGKKRQSLLNIKLKNTKFDVESELFKVINTEVSGDLTLSGRGKPFELRGDLNIESVKASKDFSIKKEILNMIRKQDIQSVSVGETPFVKFLVNIKGSRSIVVKNRNMDFLMSSDVRLTGDSSKPSIVGLATIDRGKFIFRREFRVEKGVISFDQNTRIDPYLDIIAVSDISSRRITMSITGRSSNAKVNLSAEPATDDNNNILKKWDILVLLTTGKLPKNSSGSLASQTLSILASPLENELEKLFSYSGQNIISQIYLDFEVSEATGNLVPKLIVPVNVTDDVSLNVEVDSESVWEVSSDYSVNENIFVSGSVVGKSDDTEQNNSTNKGSGLDIDDTAFDLKFRFNFQ